MARKSLDVVVELFEAMRGTVSDYGTLKRANDTVEIMIQGTAVFPGGAGLRRGEMPFGALPEDFPEDPLMFVAHNFDKESSYRESLARGIELMQDDFWKHLRAYIGRAGLSENQCFFTNVLMDLQPIKATGPMAATGLFRRQCRAFMMQQIDIVMPRCIAILGNDAAEEVRQIEILVSCDRLLHPSALRYRKREMHAGIVAKEGAKLRRLWDSAKDAEYRTL